MTHEDRTPNRIPTVRRRATRTARTAVLFLAIGALSIALAACSTGPASPGGSPSGSASALATRSPSGSGSASVAPSRTAPAGSPSAGPTPQAPATTVAAVATCAPESLDVVLAGSDSGAGNIDWTVRLTNRGSRACTVSGAPTARLLSAEEAQLGAAATGSGARGPEVRLQPGAAAVTVVRIVHVGEDGGPLAGRCTPQRAIALTVDSDVYGRYDRLDGSFRGCSEARVPYMTVSPFRAEP